MNRARALPTTRGYLMTNRNGSGRGHTLTQTDGLVMATLKTACCLLSFFLFLLFSFSPLSLPYILVDCFLSCSVSTSLSLSFPRLFYIWVSSRGSPLIMFSLSCMGFMVRGGSVFTRATCLLYYGVFDTLHMDFSCW